MTLRNAALKSIKKERIRKGKTQADIASIIHISTDAYRKIESGKSPLDLNRLELIFNFLEITFSEFFSNEYFEPQAPEILKIENQWLKKEIENVREEIWYLRETNDKLIKIINPKGIDMKTVKKTQAIEWVLLLTISEMEIVFTSKLILDGLIWGILADGIITKL